MAVPAAGEPDERSAARTTPPRQLIVTVYGLYSRERGGWLSIASLIALLADLDVDEPAVRSSISRLKRRGILLADRRDGAAGYELSDQAQAIIREGDARIFRRDRPALEDGWLLAVFSVPESQRHKRHLLRAQLTRLGFGIMSGGIWIAPARLYEATAETLRRLGLTDNATLFRADHLAFGDLAEQVRQWWDLDELARLHTEFLTTHAATLDRSTDPADAFRGYVRVLTDWRRLPYLDPGLPAELLPPDWAGHRAADRFFELQAALETPARAHVASVLERS